MVDVQFEDETPQSYATFYTYQRVKGGLMGLVMRLGFAEEEKQAEHVLIGIILTCIIISTAVIFLVNRGPEGKQVPDEQIKKIMQIRPY